MRYTRTSSCGHTARNIGNIGKVANIGDCLIYTGQPIMKRTSWFSVLNMVLVSFAIIKFSITYRSSRGKDSIVRMVCRWEGCRIQHLCSQIYLFGVGW